MGEPQGHSCLPRKRHSSVTPTRQKHPMTITGTSLGDGTPHQACAAKDHRHVRSTPHGQQGAGQERGGTCGGTGVSGCRGTGGIWMGVGCAAATWEVEARYGGR